MNKSRIHELTCTDVLDGTTSSVLTASCFLMLPEEQCLIIILLTVGAIWATRAALDPHATSHWARPPAPTAPGPHATPVRAARPRHCVALSPPHRIPTSCAVCATAPVSHAIRRRLGRLCHHTAPVRAAHAAVSWPLHCSIKASLVPLVAIWDSNRATVATLIARGDGVCFLEEKKMVRKGTGWESNPGPSAARCGCSSIEASLRVD